MKKKIIALLVCLMVLMIKVQNYPVNLGEVNVATDTDNDDDKTQTI